MVLLDRTAMLLVRLYDIIVSRTTYCTIRILENLHIIMLDPPSTDLLFRQEASASLERGKLRGKHGNPKEQEPTICVTSQRLEASRIRSNESTLPSLTTLQDNVVILRQLHDSLYQNQPTIHPTHNKTLAILLFVPFS